LATYIQALPGLFILNRNTDKKLVSDNPKQNYHSKRTYNLIRPDSNSASISGKVKGVAQTENYPMTKKK